MSQITAAAVKELRDRTDMPMMDCKAALTEAGGDMDKAVLILRGRGKKFTDNKAAGRETAEGRVGTFVDPAARVAAIIELRCETPSVVKNDLFVKLANDVARHVAHKNPADPAALLADAYVDEPGRTVQDRINDVVGLIREAMRPARFVRVEGLCGNYVHHDGTVGVLLEVKGEKADPALLRDVCAHVAALQPPYLRVEDVPADVVERERAFAKQQAEEKSSGKPANIIEKIAEGMLNTWFGENVLLKQPIANQIKYPKKTVGELLSAAKLELVRFVRFRVGEQS